MSAPDGRAAPRSRAGSTVSMIAFGGRRGPHRSGSRCRGRPIERREAGLEGCLWPNAASQGQPPDGSGLRRESERSTSNGRAKTLWWWWWWWWWQQLRITSGRLPRIWGSIVCLTHRAGIQSACGIVPNGPRGRSRSARHATARARVRVWRPRRLSAAPPAARPRCTPRSHTTHTRRGRTTGDRLRQRAAVRFRTF